MISRNAAVIESHYLQDETAWLDATSELLRQGRLAEIDHSNLAKYLTDMANRDRREVFSRLVVHLSQLLMWEYQPSVRCTSWRGTILEQRRELRLLLESGTLRNHTHTIFAEAYADARKQAAAETGWDRSLFPEVCQWNWDEIFGDSAE